MTEIKQTVLKPLAKAYKEDKKEFYGIILMATILALTIFVIAPTIMYLY
jgi:hypothetical protein